MFKYLDVKEAESPLLPALLFVAGLEVSKEAGSSKTLWYLYIPDYIQVFWKGQSSR